MRQTLVAIGLLIALSPNLPSRHNFSPIPVARECTINNDCYKQCTAAKRKDCGRVCTFCG
jgi:hypothetical protein